MNLLLTKDQKQENPSRALTFKYLSELKEGEEFWIDAGGAPFYMTQSLWIVARQVMSKEELNQRVITIDK